MSLHVVTIGETNKRLRVTLLDADGSPVEIGGGSVSMVFNNTSSGSNRTVRDMTVVDTGSVEYVWTSEDFDILTAGDWLVQFILVRGGLIDIFPCRKNGSKNSDIYDIIRVRPAL